MASRSLDQRAALVEQSWADTKVHRIFLVDDWLESVPREKQWRSMAAERGEQHKGGSGPVDASYWDAQGRQLEYMRTFPQLSDEHSGVKWVMLADDDTWVHMRRVLTFVENYDPAVPVFFTYVLSDAHVLGYDYPCGGSGMLLSATAYEMLAPRLLSPACPLLSFNDLTLGFCAHSQGIPIIHHPNMHCSPDVNRAMRPAENLLDIQKGLAVHRLPAFPHFAQLLGTLEQLQNQFGALMEHGCKLAARSREADRGLVLDSRRFFWTVDAFEDIVKACRAGAPQTPRGGALHLDFVFFGGGVPVARYQKDRRTPLVAEPRMHGARWPDWLEQARSLECAGGHGDSFAAQWLDSKPRISRRQLEASDLEQMAAESDLSVEEIRASFANLERGVDRGSWISELKRAVRRMKPKEATKVGPGRQWLFLSFAPSTTFVNVFESVRMLRAVSDLYRSDAGENPSASDARSVVDLSAEDAPPLGLAYEYFDYHVEHDAGLWLNRVAMERILRCPALNHPLVFDQGAHANDWDTESERLSLLWHNALAIDIFRTLRFCGVLVLHTPRMIPHSLAYLPYSTYRRTHAPSVLSAMTIGNVPAREQMFAMTQLVRRRACQLQRQLNASKAPLCPAEWRPPFRMRVLGVPTSPAFTERNWYLPGARFLGMSVLAFRSEHFLPDAQAV
mmetsp:Transcript_181342/g.575511  ORF Transcript_181342/g.575511 Transcript_181342/m.575511 type:complete len:675 (-) Transcript_181342:283-2307(-)